MTGAANRQWYLLTAQLATSLAMAAVGIFCLASGRLIVGLVLCAVAVASAKAFTASMNQWTKDREDELREQRRP